MSCGEALRDGIFTSVQALFSRAMSGLENRAGACSDRSHKKGGQKIVASCIVGSVRAVRVGNFDSPY